MCIQLVEIYAVCGCLYFQHPVDRCSQTNKENHVPTKREIKIGFACSRHSREIKDSNAYDASNDPAFAPPIRPAPSLPIASGPPTAPIPSTPDQSSGPIPIALNPSTISVRIASYTQNVHTSIAPSPSTASIPTTSPPLTSSAEIVHHAVTAPIRMPAQSRSLGTSLSTTADSSGTAFSIASGSSKTSASFSTSLPTRGCCKRQHTARHRKEFYNQQSSQDQSQLREQELRQRQREKESNLKLEIRDLREQNEYLRVKIERLKRQIDHCPRCALR